MSSRIEGMIKMVLGAMGIDPAEVQKEVVTRVQNFEKDFATLSNNIARIHHDNAEIKHNLQRLFKANGQEWIELPMTAKEENANDAGNSVPQIARAN